MLLCSCLFTEKLSATQKEKAGVLSLFFLFAAAAAGVVSVAEKKINGFSFPTLF